MRNRLSAQQARERKKQYQTTLEMRLSQAEQRVNKLLADNGSLRRLLMTRISGFD